MKYFEDFIKDEKFVSDLRYLISEAEIIEFASQWDPQPFHIDPQTAAKTEMGQVFASAQHTMAITTRLAHDSGFYDIAMVAGFGVDEMRTPRPVFGGDQIGLKLTIYDVKESASRPHQGIVTYAFEAFNQHDETVMTYRLVLLVNKR
ncbi:MAG: MaoC/PaaZ C-terminal domain-containing protein [Porticoccaceae bacterium]|nr:hypothetical protein [Pseudomonadales bacterium]MCP5173412.1 dehydratase [Pseudomonadales bacterium]MCP5303224.1 dehydratase [Pseudomonadales bacterium]